MRIYVFMLISLMFAGCAVESLERTGLVRPNSPEPAYVVESNIDSPYEHQLFGTRYDASMLAGSYRLYMENKVGKFYVGETECLLTRGSDGLFYLQPGGVWIPADEPKRPRMFYLPGQTLKGKTLNEVLAVRRLRAPGRANEDGNKAAANVTMQFATQPRTGGVVGGLAAGLVTGLLDMSLPLLLPPSTDPSFDAKVRAIFKPRS